MYKMNPLKIICVVFFAISHADASCYHRGILRKSNSFRYNRYLLYICYRINYMNIYCR